MSDTRPAKVTVLRDGEVDCDLFTRREGVLSSVGHDLRLRATRSTWTIDWSALTLEARIDAAAIVLACAREGDRDAPEALSESDRRKIEAAMRDEVLKVKRFPEVALRATFKRDDDRVSVEADVTLVGVTQRIRSEAVLRAGRWEARATLDQRSFGIRPYTALFGAIKVRSLIELRVSIPAKDADGSV